MSNYNGNDSKNEQENYQNSFLLIEKNLFKLGIFKRKITKSSILAADFGS